jgi:hypothetical protein
MTGDRRIAELIERLEKATWPDRVLDDLIARDVLGWVTEDKDEYWRFFNLPYYTASIEAALTLVPEGHRWEITDNGIDAQITRSVPPSEYWEEVGPFACVERKTYPDGDWSARTHGAAIAATPAIALCIAALKARSNSTGAP